MPRLDVVPLTGRAGVRAAGEVSLPTRGVREGVLERAVRDGGSGVLTVSAEDGHVRCEVRDRGRLTDPPAGRRPAGRGLLPVDLVADPVLTHAGADGTTIRAHVGH
ncbi:hypothetical protein [Streptomyces collinus]|uniref:hypothetical protein n=1 Tax=Streptomyces collinus TaxID=42684 RepID=UPI0036ED7F84